MQRLAKSAGRCSPACQLVVLTTSIAATHPDRRDVAGTDRVVRAHVVRNAENVASFVDKKMNDDSKPARPSSPRSRQLTEL